jgi:hypothetical protein
MSRQLALSKMTGAALRIGREFKLSHVELIDVLAKLTAAMTEAAVNAVESAGRAPEEPMTSVEAATRSTHNMSTIELEVGRAIFDTATGVYWHVDNDGSNPCPMDGTAAPKTGWKPVLNPDLVELIHLAPAPEERKDS